MYSYFIEDNLLSLYEFELDEWEYILEFTNKEMFYDINELVFEGLDTHADVYLNDLLVIIFIYYRYYKPTISIEHGEY